MVGGGSRLDRVSDLIRAELSDLLLKGLKDPRVKEAMVTVNRVEVSPDLRHARVFVSCLAGDEALEGALSGLASAAGYLRRELGKRVSTKYVPSLRFEKDPLPEQTRRLEEAFHRISEEDS